MKKDRKQLKTPKTPLPISRNCFARKHSTELYPQRCFEAFVGSYSWNTSLKHP
ncbi:hypothetical protein QOT17_023529, partial [Balamuthia mandrillaris]